MFSNYVPVKSSPPLLTGGDTHIQASFDLKGVNVTVANALRRAILTHTPSVGFRTEPYDKSQVEILKNTTPLVNEMLAHRIGMIPICVSDWASFDPDAYQFELNMKNDDKSKLLDVRAGDIQVYFVNPRNPMEAPVQLDSKQFFPPDPITGETILITRLRPQTNAAYPVEQLHFRAKASVSTGKENIRWCPVSQSSYEYTRDTDPEHIEATFQTWIEANKKKMSTPEQEAALRREFETMEIQRCYLKDEFGNPNSFTFHIESIGVQPIPNIVLAGLEGLERLVKSYVDMDKIIPSNIRIQKSDTRFPALDIIFENEGHSLGNLLETFLVENHTEEGKSEPYITYAGYKVPHPLRQEMFVRIGVPETDRQELIARQAIAATVKHILGILHVLKQSWVQLLAPPGSVPASVVSEPEAAPEAAPEAEVDASNNNAN
jgi:DNA-directed RNA polymerase subunit L/DNA-directed RNA polymerase alpha subunit